MEQEFKVKFRGVRGSIPVPGKSTLKYGGNTTCIEIRVAGHLIILMQAQVSLVLVMK